MAFCSKGPSDIQHDRSSDDITDHPTTWQVIRWHDRSSHYMTGHQMTWQVIPLHDRSSDDMTGHPTTWQVIRWHDRSSQYMKCWQYTGSAGMKKQHRSTHPWWCHDMEMLSTLLALCAGNPLATGGFLAQNGVMRSFNVFVIVVLNKLLKKLSSCHWNVHRCCHPCVF